MIWFLLSSVTATPVAAAAAGPSPAPPGPYGRPPAVFEPVPFFGVRSRFAAIGGGMGGVSRWMSARLAGAFPRSAGGVKRLLDTDFCVGPARSFTIVGNRVRTPAAECCKA